MFTKPMLRAGANGASAALTVAGAAARIKATQAVEPTSDEIERAAAVCEADGNIAPLEKMMHDLKALRKASLDMLAHKRAEEGLEAASAAPSLPRFRHFCFGCCGAALLCAVLRCAGKLLWGCYRVVRCKASAIWWFGNVGLWLFVLQEWW